MTIQWKSGSQFTCAADVAHKQIEVIRKKTGKVLPEDVVRVAKSKCNPLHSEFEWDDATAALAHRVERARLMLRSFMVVRDDLKTDRPQRIYEVVREPQEKPGRIKHVYRTVEDIMTDKDLRAELLGRALGELISLRNRYRDLQELAIVMRAIDEVVETVKV